MFDATSFAHDWGPAIGRCLELSIQDGDGEVPLRTSMRDSLAVAAACVCGWRLCR
jgi:hypothetical protein